MTTTPKFELGTAVFDGASQLETMVVARTLAEGTYFYELAPNVPLNPTGDGAFPDRWRHDGEICAPADRETLKDFMY